jgi:hypothetical protein
MAAIAWTDENTSIVTELFAEEVGRGNRSSTHLNNVGYDEVARRFKDKTGISLKKSQLKNKCDKLKNEYSIWKRLLKQTGAGWDHTRETFEQDKEWWKKAKIVSLFRNVHGYDVSKLLFVVICVTSFYRTFQVVAGFKSKVFGTRNI